MGNTCCGGNDPQTELNDKNAPVNVPEYGSQTSKPDREELAAVKIQANYRGMQARRMVLEEHQWQTRLGRMPSSTIPQTDEQIEAARAKVREIQRTLKPFEYSV